MTDARMNNVGAIKKRFLQLHPVNATSGGTRLEKLLTSCKNQCWDCHECERTFGMEDIDSALQLRLKS